MHGPSERTFDWKGFKGCTIISSYIYLQRANRVCMIKFCLFLMLGMQNIFPENITSTASSDLESIEMEKAKDEETSLKQKDAIRAVIEGREDFFRNMTIYSPSPMKSFQKNATRATYFSDADFPLYNGVLEEDLGSDLKDSDIEEVVLFFKSRQRSFCWWTSSKKLESKGFKLGGIMKGVALDISQRLPIPSAIPDGLKIKIVQTEAQLHEFCRICTAVPRMGTHMIKHYENVCGLTMKQNEQLHFLAYLNDIPVATLTLTLSNESAGIWNAATLAEYRKNGIFTALVHAALLEANKRQYYLVTALLMPKGMAWGVFQGFGFKEVCTFPFYLYGFDPNILEAEPR